MKYVKEFGIILIVSLVGELAELFFASARSGEHLRPCADVSLPDARRHQAQRRARYGRFLIESCPSCSFRPPVGLMASWDVIQANLVAYLIIAAVTTIVVMAVSGLVTQEVLKKGKKGAEKK